MHIILSPLFLFLLLSSCRAQGPVLEIMGTKEIDERISTPLNERDFTMSPDGHEIYFTRSSFDNRQRFIAYIRWVDGRWTDPAIASFSGWANDLEPFISPNGQQLFFATNRTLDGGTKKDFDIWVVNKSEAGWGEPKPLDTLINTDQNEFYPAVSRNGNLYFTATRSDSKGTEDIYISAFNNGKYSKPISLPSTINTATYEYNAYISPDENILIFGSYGRKDDVGGGDLYYSIKDKEGHWTEAQTLGPQVNTDDLDYCPYLDFQNQRLYFTSNKGKKDLMADLKAYEEQVLGVENGYGNIFSLPFTIK